MTSNPEDIRRDIERTRRELSGNVDALTEKVSPSRVVERRVESARSAITNVKEKVMGSADDGYRDVSGVGNGSSDGYRYGSGDGNGSGGGNGSAMSSAASSVSGAASSVAGTASAAPEMARQRTQGNPFAAGLIAFGAGWLISSVLPASEKEQRAALAIKDKASEHSDKVTAPLKEAAQQMGEDLRVPAQQAAESVKSTATEAASTVKDDAQSAKADVADQAKQSKETVASSGGSNDPGPGGTGTTDYSRSTYGV